MAFKGTFGAWLNATQPNASGLTTSQKKQLFPAYQQAIGAQADKPWEGETWSQSIHRLYGVNIDSAADTIANTLGVSFDVAKIAVAGGIALGLLWVYRFVTRG
jgi:hypothetical protein